MPRPVALAVFMFASTSFAADPPPVNVGSLQAVPPADWKAEKPANRLRSHQFRLPSGVDGVIDGEVTVRQESGNKPAVEFPRWKAEIVPPDGKTLDDLAKGSSFEVGAATVHVLDATGTWKYKPFPQAKKEELRPDYRVIWVIVAEKETGTHIRLSGPQAVVEKYKKGFDAWLKALK